jgi:hypothetical protein
VECDNPACASFFVTPLQLSPVDFGVLEDLQQAYRCSRCRTVHRQGEHLFLLLDGAA